jgi:hypothetical protein
MDDTGFSLRNNAKRAAERMIHNGTAPSIGYGLRTREDGRFEIVWKSGAPDPASSEDVPEGYTGRDIPDGRYRTYWSRPTRRTMLRPKHTRTRSTER